MPKVVKKGKKGAQNKEERGLEMGSLDKLRGGSAELTSQPIMEEEDARKCWGEKVHMRESFGERGP